MSAPARRAAGLALALALATAAGACSSQGPGYLQRFGSAALADLAPPEREPPRERTREELNQIPYATIGITFDRATAYLVPISESRGALDYRDASGRSIRMRGGALAATEGLGLDLEAVRFAQDDPVAHQRPLADWPARVFREYQYQPRSRPQHGITLACEYQTVAAETIEIVEILFDLVRVSETCTNQARQVVNTYWVEEETGFIWKSEQWMGPPIGHVTIEIIRPWAG